MIRRIWHGIFGHPRAQVVWGNVHEGATCQCGAHWTIADYQI